MPVSPPRLSRVLMRAIVVLCGVVVVYMCVAYFSVSSDSQPPRTRTMIRRPQTCTGRQCHRNISRDEEYAQYFIPRKEKVNPFRARYMIPNKALCSSGAPVYLAILVPSVLSHVTERDAIRNTWGSIVKDNKWPHHNINVTTKLVFLFGKDTMVETNKIAQSESKIFGDVVQGDFTDTYSNLSRKILLGLHWVQSYCRDAQYVLKADEDTFINIPKLLKVLFQTRHRSYQGVVIGNIHEGAQVKRKGRWAVRENDYPFPHYPPYAFGNTYVISANIASTLFRTSEHMPYIPIEDAFITGILAKAVDADLIKVEGFTYWNDSPPHACDFIQERRISATKTSADMKRYIWEKLISNTDTLKC